MASIHVNVFCAAGVESDSARVGLGRGARKIGDYAMTVSELIDEMTRAEHLQWSKDDAKQYLPHDPLQALAMMISNLEEHDELSSNAAITLGKQGLMLPEWIGDPGHIARFIDGIH